ncbi:MAG: glycosyltransferase family 4 protein [bacterium]|nr:glycosyltransferase family 4 protein [bacterium]
MKVLILTPTCLPDLTGNAMTAERLRFGLGREGIEVEVIRADDSNLSSRIEAFGPDIIHALHARKSGAAAMDFSGRHKAPYLVTITGTDLYPGLPGSNEKDLSLVLQGAGAVIVYSELTSKRLLSGAPSLAGKTRVIKKGIHFNHDRHKVIRSQNRAAFLLPSGIRPVKATTFVIDPLEKLRQEFPDISLTVAGPILDDAEWELFCRKAEGKDWVRHLTVSHDEMPGLYGEAEIVLNSSISEGLSNAVLEAMHFGRPVLASDCEGNMAAFSSGEGGLFYKGWDEKDFINKARRLLSDRLLRLELGSKGREKILKEHTLDVEIKGHIKIYKELLQTGDHFQG